VSDPTTASTPDPLSPTHRGSLEVGSGITPAVIADRGYRTVTSKAALAELGFSTTQRRVPALLIPVLGISGEVETYQLRPDLPRISKGKPIKYETPSGSRMALDVPPTVRDKVLDITVPILITEGVKKADAAASRDIACLALLGVWNWRGTDDQGGKRLLADFERIPWNGRTVYLVFDSDLLEKEPVAKALLRLGRVLEHSLKARVRVVRLPSDLSGFTTAGVPPVPRVPRIDEEGGAA